MSFFVFRIYFRVPSLAVDFLPALSDLLGRRGSGGADLLNGNRGDQAAEGGRMVQISAGGQSGAGCQTGSSG